MEVLFFQGGWGKIASAASTQYVLDAYSPDLLVNLGTCGGFGGRIRRGTVILVTKTIVYDIIEQMSDPDDAIAHFSTMLDLSWLEACDFKPDEFQPLPLVRTLLVSADRDIRPEDITALKDKFGAVAADWESGAIAWVCKRNKTRCLILRAVTDLVDTSGGEAYGDIEFFRQNTKNVMGIMVEKILAWLDTAGRAWVKARSHGEFLKKQVQDRT